MNKSILARKLIDIFVVSVYRNSFNFTVSNQKIISVFKDDGEYIALFVHINNMCDFDYSIQLKPTVKYNLSSGLRSVPGSPYYTLFQANNSRDLLQYINKVNYLLLLKGT